MEIDCLNGVADELEQKLHSQELELTKLREMEKQVKIIMEKSYKGSARETIKGKARALQFVRHRTLLGYAGSS